MNEPTRIDDELLERARSIRLAVFDIDGVMTDGRLYRDDSGQEIKAFYSRDGLGLKALMRYDIQVAALTARESRLVRKRIAELGIEQLIQGREDKGAALAELLATTGVDASRTVYMGDDLVDWPALRDAGFKACPRDADPWIAEKCDFVAQRDGGRGAVRDLCELLLSARGKLSEWRNSFG
jgi:3-deoxy-D-manno-octulosonate 8-phosphate phosphatase (KDO 8-P phosphatase)